MKRLCAGRQGAAARGAAVQNHPNCRGRVLDTVLRMSVAPSSRRHGPGAWTATAPSGAPSLPAGRRPSLRQSGGNRSWKEMGDCCRRRERCAVRPVSGRRWRRWSGRRLRPAYAWGVGRRCTLQESLALHSRLGRIGGRPVSKTVPTPPRGCRSRARGAPMRRLACRSVRSLIPSRPAGPPVARVQGCARLKSRAHRAEAERAPSPDSSSSVFLGGGVCTLRVALHRPPPPRGAP